ncbi:DUF3179 domain-containing protein [Glycomyces sp. L485]|uniref:DUF3179 domain-containing protein n=1 Tax=Glycomyces sp. L485 TaxID=2909235 RepID=UPI001F4BBE0C|nr:DUF3179 domain-containing protein [Glycomyces sp. L485]MCH7230908.1 DUF3179 domain-containing protein [Glycomyces sp. L485]
MRARHRIWIAAAAAAALVTLASCSSGTGADDEGTALPQDGAAETRDVPSALDDMHHPDFPEPLIDPDQVLSGGPPPDGIPPIDEPKFVKTGEVDWLADSEPVLSLTVGDETRAYPLQIMMWHEIVNETVGDVPVAVTYCPLCNSGVAFERTVDGEVFTFGTSGMLFESNLVMYDRQTESLWPQLTGVASIGHLTGTELVSIPMGTVSWGDYREAHPDTWVLSRDTGFDRAYGSNPYTGYDSADAPGFGASTDDDRLALMARVVGIGTGDDAVAVVRSAVAESGVLSVTVGAQEAVVLHSGGQSSALDSGQIAEGADIGSVGVFDPVVEGEALTFTPAGDGFTDAQTGSTWNILGEATAGPLEGTELEAVEHLDTFWFAWAAFQPDTRITPD